MPPKSEPKALATTLPRREVHFSAISRQTASGPAIILSVAVIGLMLTLQGWKSRPPAFDMVTYFNSAENLLKRGVLPAYGDVSSYGSFSPPGTAWLMAPGMLLFNDPRLYEKLGGAVLHLGTLLGVFLLARETLGIRCAYLSVAIYGLSGLGLAFAGSLWPIGHPFFYVWMVYFAIRWVTRNDPRYLAAALTTVTVGMYDDMAITPIALILPAMWIVYRPPLFSKLLLVTGVVTFAVWYPYLQFEVARGFADLKSQFLLHNIFPANYREAWCDPNLTLNTIANTSTPPVSNSTPSQGVSGGLPGILALILTRAHTMLNGLLANLNEVAPLPGFSIVLLLPLLGSIVVLGVFATRVVRGRLIPARISTSSYWQRNLGEEKKTELLLLSLLVPWIVLLIVAEPGRPERFFWMWPLQAIVLAAFFTNLLPQWQVPLPVLWLSQILLVIAMLMNPLQAHLGPWLRDGWDGSDPEEVRVVDYVASQLQAEGKDQAAIGYQTIIYPFMVKYDIIDPQYKVGAEFDLLLKYQHGILNTDHCAEGISPVDEYRIVQTRPKSGDVEPRDYVDAPRDSSFHPLHRFDLYEVFKRD